MFTVRGEYCIGVGLGVRVDTDDERMCLRDNGVYSVRFPSLRWAMTRSLTTDAGPVRNHFGAYL